MNFLRRLALLVAAGLVGLSVFGSFSWMPVNVSRLGQSVPSRTPTPGPATATPLSESPTPTLGASTPAPPVTATLLSPTASVAETPALLPVAGTAPMDGTSVTAAAGIGLVALAGIVRRRTAHPCR